MTIKAIKLDADGKVEMKDGFPIYIYEDGSESPFDAVKTVGTLNAQIDDLKVGNEKHKTVNTKLRGELKPFKDLDPAKAREALETVTAMSAKEILDANGVKALKVEMRNSFEGEKVELVKGFNTEKQDLVAASTTKDSTIRHLMITSEFAKSDYFTGAKPKTIYPPSDAVKIFGGSFKVQGEGPEVKVVAVNSDGETPLMSKQNHGEPAEFNEAIGLLIESHPQKNRIMNVSPGGPGGGFGNQGAGGELDENAKGIDLIAAGLKKQHPDKFANQ